MDLLKIKNTLCVDIYSYADEQGITLRVTDVDKITGAGKGVVA